MVQAVEHLPSKHETLILNLSATKKKNKKRPCKGSSKNRTYIWACGSSLPATM
jgi:hypothetical protein